MNKTARMLMMTNSRKDENRHDRRRDDYDPYAVDDRFRDRRGREHYDNGRYAPQNAGDSWVYNRYDGYPESRQERYPDMRRAEPSPSMNGSYGRDYESRPLSRIGFEIGGEMERLPREFDHDFRRDEMAYRTSGQKQRGYTNSNMIPPLDRKTAEEWTRGMKNSDGSTGPHWPFEQAEQLLTQHKLDFDPAQFYAVLNAVYSDFCAVAKKHGVSNLDFYVDLAKAWLDDKDAVPDKAAAYYRYVVEH